jgi:hypothetical protein
MACDFAVNALDGSFFDRPALHKFPRSAEIKLKGRDAKTRLQEARTMRLMKQPLGEGT